MACPEEKEIAAYLKGEMLPAAIKGFEEHVEACDKCAAQLYRMSESLKSAVFLERTLELVRNLQGA